MFPRKDSVIRNFRITAGGDKNYNTRNYNLSAIIAVGYKEYTVKVYVMDDECLKKVVNETKKRYAGAGRSCAGHIAC